MAVAVKVSPKQTKKILVKVIKTGLDSAIRSAKERGKYLYWSRIVECTLPDGKILRLYAQGYKLGERKSRDCDNLIYPDEMNKRAFKALNPHLKKTDDEERLRLGRLFLDYDVIYVNPERFVKGPMVAVATNESESYSKTDSTKIQKICPQGRGQCFYRGKDCMKNYCPLKIRKER